MSDHVINDDQIKTLFYTFINFDLKGFHEVMDEVRKTAIKNRTNHGRDQALNEGDGVYRP